MQNKNLQKEILRQWFYYYFLFLLSNALISWHPFITILIHIWLPYYTVLLTLYTIFILVYFILSQNCMWVPMLPSLWNDECGTTYGNGVCSAPFFPWCLETSLVFLNLFICWNPSGAPVKIAVQPNCADHLEQTSIAQHPFEGYFLTNMATDEVKPQKILELIADDLATDELGARFPTPLLFVGDSHDTPSSPQMPKWFI